MTNNEEQKSVIDKMLSKIGLTTIKLEAEKVALEQMKLDDETTVIEAEVFEAGNPVMIVAEDEQMIPLPVGVYGLEDGRELEVQEEGVIFEVREKAVEEEAPVEEAPVAASEKPAVAPVAKKVVESVSKESYFSKATEDEVIELIAKVVELKLSEAKVAEEVELSAKPIVHNPEKVSLATKLNTKEGLTGFLNNIK
jgi:hypothetical protein